MDKAEAQEGLVTLYLRLNGYFTSGFIVQSAVPGQITTELDVLAVRFPRSAQPEREVGTAEELETSDDRIDFVIGEVKSRGQQLQFNEALRCSRESVLKTLRWWGHFTEEECLALAEPVATILSPSPGADHAPSLDGPRCARVRALLFSPERNARRGNQAWFLPGPPIFAYVWKCLRPCAPRAACATTYDYGRWGRDLEPIVRYFKDERRHEAGGLDELLEFLDKDAR